MKFEETLEAQAVPAWRQHYVDYRGLKQALQVSAAAANAAVADGSPHLASLSMPRPRVAPLEGEELFIVKLQQELAKVGDFVRSKGTDLQAALRSLRRRCEAPGRADLGALRAQARALGDEVLHLERYVHLNEVACAKIIKKHDKHLPESPLWHFYVGHLAHQQWMSDDRGALWGQVGAIFQHLHAPAVVPGTPVASATAPTAAAAAAGGAGAGAGAAGGAAQHSVHKYWVPMEDVPQVIYYILQHMPLVPRPSQSRQQERQHRQSGVWGAAGGGGAAGAASSHRTAGAASGLDATASGGAAAEAAVVSGRPSAVAERASRSAPPSPQPQPSHMAAAGQDLDAEVASTALDLASGPTFMAAAAATATAASGGGAGPRGGAPFASEGSGSGQAVSARVHTVYLDNAFLELYHGRLYLRPNAKTLKLKWLEPPAGHGVRPGASLPERVVLERKIYREGWKDEPNIKSALVLAGDKVASFLAGTYTLQDALAGMVRTIHQPAALLPGAGLAASPATAAKRTQAAAAEPSPFSGVEAQRGGCGGGAAAATGSRVGSPQPSLAAAAAAAAGSSGGGAAPAEGPPPSRRQSALTAALAAVAPPPRAAPSFNSSAARELATPFAAAGAAGAAAAARRGSPSPSEAPLAAAAAAAARGGRAPRPSIDAHLIDGDDSLLDMSAAAAGSGGGGAAGGREPHLLASAPSSDQLALFSEVQALVARKALRPLLHVQAQRLLFQMPFDASLRVTLDTDVVMLRLDEIWDAHHGRTDALWGELFADQLQHDPAAYALPYALLKISTALPDQRSLPPWLKVLMASSTLSEVEDWSKFVHGAAVLCPETVRAVPYWVDDPLIEASTERIRHNLEVLMAQEEAAAAEASASATAYARSGSAAASGPAGAAGDDSPRAGSAPTSTAAAMGDASAAAAGGGAGVEPASASRNDAAGGARVRWRDAPSDGAGDEPPPGSARSGGAGVPAALRQRLSWLAPTASSRSLFSPSDAPSAPSPRAAALSFSHSLTRQGSLMDLVGSVASSLLAGADAAVERLGGGAQRLSRRVSRQRRSERREEEAAVLSSNRRAGRAHASRYVGNPVQLLQAREFLHNEGVFIAWLRMAVAMSGVALLLLAFSAMARYNPASHPEIHLSETITLMMLPTSCLMVAYAIFTYWWRVRRLYRPVQRFKPYHDTFGPNAAVVAVVTMLSAVLLVNAADLAILWHKAHPRPAAPPPLLAEAAAPEVWRRW